MWLALATVGGSLRDPHPVSERPDYISLAREKLDEARRLVEQTEKPYEPHVPDWDEWEPPEYVGVFKKGDIIGYHCRDGEIDRLERLLLG